MGKPNDDFLRIMNGLGVRPIGPDEKPEKNRNPRDPVFPDEKNDSDEALFRQALDHLDRVPDKDNAKPVSEEERLRKVKLLKKLALEFEDRLDLHGKTTETALNELASFVAKAFAKSRKTVVVITGKGKHSKGGVGVLKPRVEQWILQKGKRFIRSYAEAPRAYGGKGAFILYLRAR